MRGSLNGIKGDDYVEPIIEHQLPERTRVQHILCDFTKDLSDQDICQRRIDAVNAITALCRRREVQRHKRRRVTKQHQKIERYRTTQSQTASGAEETGDLDPFPMFLNPRQYPICIGDEELPVHTTGLLLDPSLDDVGSRRKSFQRNTSR